MAWCADAGVPSIGTVQPVHEYLTAYLDGAGLLFDSQRDDHHPEGGLQLYLGCHPEPDPAAALQTDNLRKPEFSAADL